MLKGTKRISKSHSLDETKFIEYVKKNKEKYSVIEFNDEFLVAHWSVKSMVEDYRKTLEKPKEQVKEKKSKKS
jgi:hypothetical protein